MQETAMEETSVVLFPLSDPYPSRESGPSESSTVFALRESRHRHYSDDVCLEVHSGSFEWEPRGWPEVAGPLDLPLSSPLPFGVSPSAVTWQDRCVARVA